MLNARELLREIKDTKKERKDERKLVISPKAKVSMPTFDRDTTIAAAARYFKIVSRRVKSLETELDAVKAVIRETGNGELERELMRGEYYGAADCAGVKVTRANKYSPVEVNKDKLVEFVGESYGVMFKEQATLTFKSIDSMRAHLRLCQEMGIPVECEHSEVVVGRPGLRQRICEIWNSLDEQKKTVLLACAKDQAPRVGGR